MPLSFMTACSNMEAHKWNLGQISELPMSLIAAHMDSMKQSLQQKIERTAQYTESEISVASQGQHTVQAVIEKATVLFSQLHAVKLNNEKAKLESSAHLKEVKDTLDALKQLFLKLRRTYDECKKRVELPTGKGVEEMIPLKNEKDGKMEIPESDCASKASTEYQELELKLREKNKQIKELIDKMRSLIWDINMMMALKPR